MYMSILYAFILKYIKIVFAMSMDWLKVQVHIDIRPYVMMSKLGIKSLIEVGGWTLDINWSLTMTKY